MFKNWVFQGERVWIKRDELQGPSLQEQFIYKTD